MTKFLTTFALALAGAVFVRPAVAASDPLALELSPGLQVVFRGASDPADRVVSLDFSPTTRTAFTATTPLLLPCDLQKLIGNALVHNTGTSALYPELQARLLTSGTTPIANIFGNLTTKIPLPVLAPGATTGPGYIVVDSANPVYLPSSLPANTPVQMSFLVRGYTQGIMNPIIGGYSQTFLITEPLQNNTMYIWVQRHC